MPAIADQVTSLENDHAAALAQIATMSSQIATQAAQITSLTADKAQLQLDLANLQTHVDEVKSLVENMATGALTMLKAVQAKAVAGGEKLAQDVETKITAGVADVLGILPEAPPIAPVEAQQSTAAALPAPSPAPTSALPSLGPAPEWAKNSVIAKVESAVDRMLHHSSGSQTQIRRPVDLTMHVDHDDGGLPIFLRRDTVFQRGDRPLV